MISGTSSPLKVIFAFIVFSAVFDGIRRGVSARTQHPPGIEHLRPSMWQKQLHFFTEFLPSVCFTLT
jgi:formate hydrogenlyase subunit 4